MDINSSHLHTVVLTTSQPDCVRRLISVIYEFKFILLYFGRFSSITEIKLRMDNKR